MDNIYSLTELYDEQHRDFVEDLPMHRTLALEYGPRILELGIGNARVGFDLAQNGYEVYGIDLSSDMVAFARTKAERLDLNVKIARGDMSSFSLPRLFEGLESVDLIICPFNTLCHLLTTEELLNCLSSVYRALRPGGIFAPSLFVPDPAFLYRDSEALTLVDEFHSESTGQHVEIYGRNAYTPLTQINKLDWFFSIGDEMLERSFELRMYYPQELRHLIRSSGYEIIEEWADYETRVRASQKVELPRNTVVQTLVCRK